MFLSLSVQLNRLFMIAGINSSRVTCSRGVSLSATPGAGVLLRRSSIFY